MQQILRIEISPDQTGSSWLPCYIQEIDDTTAPAPVVVSDLQPKSAYYFRLRFEFFEEADELYNEESVDGNVIAYSTDYGRFPIVTGDWSAEVTGETWPDIPATLEFASYEVLSQTEVDFRWYEVEDATEYTIEVSTDGSNWIEVFNGEGTLENGYLTVIVDTFDSDTFYYARIFASNITGDSEPSTPIEFTTWPDTPGVPVLSVTDVTNSSVTLEWDFGNFSASELLERFERMKNEERTSAT